MRSLFTGVGFAIAIMLGGSALAQKALVLEPNMKVLKAKMPDAENRFAGSNAPGQLFLPGEAVNIKLVLAKGQDAGETGMAIEIQEISTRDPGRKVEGMEGYTDTAGNAPLIGLEGKPIEHKFKATFDDKPQASVEVPNVPVPERFGTYALLLVRGAERQFLATVGACPSRGRMGT